MLSSPAQFVFMTCRAGAEGALKGEVARVEPAWHPSFSRPGFLTFKNTGERPVDAQRLAEQSWTFAHACGVSLGRLTGTQLAELVSRFWAHEGVAAVARRGFKTLPLLLGEGGGEGGLAANKAPSPCILPKGEGFDLHVWQREPEIVGDGEIATFITPLCREIEAALRAAAPEHVKIGRTMAEHRKASPRKSCVLDVVVVEPGEWWIGYHVAARLAERWPGGAIPVRMPAHAVSRAYAKMQEALQWSGLPIAAEDECVEIGCAPGGASQALLDRGLFVTGIDPAEVDPAVVEHPRFRHLKKRGTDVRRREFEGVRWLVADMNVAPEATLDEVEAIVRHPNLAIRGLVLTLKFSDWNVAERLSEFAARVRGWGYRDVRTRQLVTGGQEVCLVALKRKALRRLGRKTKQRGALSRKRHDEGHTTLPGPHF